MARIGVETGAVVVDSSGEIFGDAPNVAARVQALAEPGAILITAKVQRQVAGLFVAEDRGAHALKGVPEPTVLYRIVRASGGGRRSGQRALTPLVGREEEVAMLLRRWERARAGEGQFVADRRRARPRQVAPDRGVPRAARRYATHLGRMEFLAAVAEHAAAPDRRVGPPPFRRRRRSRRAAARRSREHAAVHQARPDRKCPAAGASARHPAAAGARIETRAGGIAAPAIGGAARVVHGGRAGAAGRAGDRGLALGRSDDARRAA